jgi:hypothetical protein
MLILKGTPRETPFPSVSFVERPEYRIVDVSRRPDVRVRAIVLHTTRGASPQPIRDGYGKGGAALANVQQWNRETRDASAHLLVDRDGTVYQTADLVSDEAWHATSVNPVSVGIEICQGSDGSLYRGQLGVAVALVHWLTDALGIQRQIPHAYTGEVPRLASGGRDVVGVYGHRDQTRRKGIGDPGDIVFELLAAEGYERFDLRAGQDLDTWRARQRDLGIAADGIPGPATVAALRAKGKRGGLWIEVPEPATGLVSAAVGVLLAAASVLV